MKTRKVENGHLRHVFSFERMLAIKAAFILWYQNLKVVKKAVMIEIGQTRKDAFDYTSGRRLPSPKVLKALYLKTGDHNFLMSTEEKRLYKQRISDFEDDQENWPDLDVLKASAKKSKHEKDAAVKTDEEVQQGASDEELANLLKDISQIGIRIKKLADLKEGDPEREKARHLLVRPAFVLFSAIFKLDLKFPSQAKEFFDQLNSLELSLVNRRINKP